MSEEKQIGGRVIEGQDIIYNFISLHVVNSGGEWGVQLVMEVPFTHQKMGKFLNVGEARKLASKLTELADFTETCYE